MGNLSASGTLGSGLDNFDRDPGSPEGLLCGRSGSFLSTPHLYGADYNWWGPWTCQCLCSCCLSPWGHRERRERQGEGSCLWSAISSAGGSGTNPGSLSACGVISPQGIARHLGLTQPHLPTLRPFQGFKKINTILANPRLQLSAFAEVTVPLTYGEANWACSLLPIDST